MLPATQFNEFIIYVLVARILVAGKNVSHPSILIVAHFDKGSVALLHSLIVSLEYSIGSSVLYVATCCTIVSCNNFFKINHTCCLKVMEHCFSKVSSHIWQGSFFYPYYIYIDLNIHFPTIVFIKKELLLW